MTLCYSIASGNWSDAGTWFNARVPQAADTVEIRNGHTVNIDAEIAAIAGTTVKSGGILKPAFVMVTSAFANIVIDSGGKLYASRTATSRLRCAGTITTNGAPGVDYGTDADPLSDNTKSATVEFVCTSDAQTSRGFVLGANDAFSSKGATRVQSSTLASLASIGANTIVLADDMALRPGTLAQAWAGLADMIIIGHTPIQTGNGAQADEIDIYLVAGYDAGTKTVTLGDAGLGDANWPRGGVTATWNTIHQTDRQIGTPVYLHGANVVIRGSAYNLRPSRGIDGNYRASVKNSLIAWNSSGIYYGSGHTISGNAISGNSSGIYYGSGHTMQNNIGTGNTNYLYSVPVADLYNCLFSGVEHYGYNSLDRLAWHYVASERHNQVAGAWKAWCRGGIVTKAANIVPTGKAYSYEHACESATFPVFRQLQYTMKRYEKLHYRAFVRKELSMTYRPRIQIIDFFADPLVDPANTALAETIMSNSTGTWEVIDCFYINNSDMPKKVLLRTLVMNASGTVYFYPSIVLEQPIICDQEGAV